MEEVPHFSEAKATTFKTGRIQNPVGFLLTAVPRCFEGQSFDSFREEQRRWKEEQRRREEEQQEKARRLEEEIRTPFLRKNTKHFMRRRRQG